MADLLYISWWGWIVFGVLLALLEMASPGGFYFIFFAVGAAVVGIFSRLGILEEPWVQVTFFSIFSILASMLLRQRLIDRFAPKLPDTEVDSLLGEIATALDEIQSTAFGKVELRGSAWNAKNTGSVSLTRGQRCVVERVDGLLVCVRAE